MLLTTRKLLVLFDFRAERAEKYDSASLSLRVPWPSAFLSYSPRRRSAGGPWHIFESMIVEKFFVTWPFSPVELLVLLRFLHRPLCALQTSSGNSLNSLDEYNYFHIPNYIWIIVDGSYKMPCRWVKRWHELVLSSLSLTYEAIHRLWPSLIWWPTCHGLSFERTQLTRSISSEIRPHGWPYTECIRHMYIILKQWLHTRR